MPETPEPPRTSWEDEVHTRPWGAQGEGHVGDPDLVERRGGAVVLPKQLI